MDEDLSMGTPGGISSQGVLFVTIGESICKHSGSF
jgi:hypothetical protein